MEGRRSERLSRTVCYRPDPASLQMRGEEPVPGLPSNRGSPVPTYVGVQRLPFGAEGVEQVQGQLPVVRFVVALQQDLQRMVTCQASPNSDNNRGGPSNCPISGPRRTVTKPLASTR